MKSFAGGAAILLIAVVVVMTRRAPLANRIRPIAFEMERNDTTVQLIFDKAGREAVKTNTTYDLYGLIPAYTLFLVLFALSSAPPKFAWTAAAFAIVAGVCDVFEDLAILQAVALPSDGAAMRIVVPAFAKWIALFAAVGLLGLTVAVPWLRILLLILAAAGIVATALFAQLGIGLCFIGAFAVLVLYALARLVLS